MSISAGLNFDGMCCTFIYFFEMRSLNVMGAFIYVLASSRFSSVCLYD